MQRYFPAVCWLLYFLPLFHGHVWKQFLLGIVFSNFLLDVLLLIPNALALDYWLFFLFIFSCPQCHPTFYQQQHCISTHFFCQEHERIGLVPTAIFGKVYTHSVFHSIGIFSTFRFFSLFIFNKYFLSLVFPLAKILTFSCCSATSFQLVISHRTLYHILYASIVMFELQYLFH